MLELNSDTDRRESLSELQDDDSSRATLLGSELTSRSRLASDDRLLSHRLQRVETDLTDSHDDFFATLGDETGDQKEASQLLDE